MKNQGSRFRVEVLGKKGDATGERRWKLFQAMRAGGGGETLRVGQPARVHMTKMGNGKKGKTRNGPDAKRHFTGHHVDRNRQVPGGASFSTRANETLHGATQVNKTKKRGKKVRRMRQVKDEEGKKEYVDRYRRCTHEKGGVTDKKRGGDDLRSISSTEGALSAHRKPSGGGARQRAKGKRNIITEPLTG